MNQDPSGVFNRADLIQNTKMPLLVEFVTRRLMLEIERDSANLDSLIDLLVAKKIPFSESVISGMAQVDDLARI